MLYSFFNFFYQTFNVAFYCKSSGIFFHAIQLVKHLPKYEFKVSTVVDLRRVKNGNFLLFGGFRIFQAWIQLFQLWFGLRSIYCWLSRMAPRFELAPPTPILIPALTCRDKKVIKQLRSLVLPFQLSSLWTRKMSGITALNYKRTMVSIQIFSCD